MLVVLSSACLYKIGSVAADGRGCKLASVKIRKSGFHPTFFGPQGAESILFGPQGAELLLPCCYVIIADNFYIFNN